MLFYINLCNLKTLAIVECDRDDAKFVAGRLQDHLRTRLGIHLLDSATEACVEAHKATNNGFNKATLPSNWTLNDIKALLDKEVDGWLLSSSKAKVWDGDLLTMTATYTIQMSEESIECEYPEGSGFRTFLTHAQRVEIIRQGDSSPDYYIIPDGETKVRTWMETQIACQWYRRVKSNVDHNHEGELLSWDDEDIIF